MALDVSLDDLTPDTKAIMLQLIDLAAQQGYTLQPRSTLRTCAEQNELYAIGRSPGDTRAIVTGVRGCRSYHVLGRAVDFNIVAGGQWGGKGSDADYANVGAIAESIGIVWGGRFTKPYDPGHFEWHKGRSIGEGLDYYCPDPADCEAATARSFADVPADQSGGDQTPPDTGTADASVIGPAPTSRWGLVAIGLAVVGAFGIAYWSARRTS